MEFVQVIEFTTTKYDEVRAIGNKFAETRRTGGGPKPQTILFLKDRDRPNTYGSVAVQVQPVRRLGSRLASRLDFRSEVLDALVAEGVARVVGVRDVEFQDAADVGNAQLGQPVDLVRERRPRNVVADVAGHREVDGALVSECDEALEVGPARSVVPEVEHDVRVERDEDHRRSRWSTNAIPRPRRSHLLYELRT
jgi:hypothetical protein